MTEIRHVCVQWPRLGPYHLARLAALAERLRTEGVRLTALETARLDETYAWDEAQGADGFERVVALADAAAESTPPARTRAAVTAALDRIRPDALAVTSYSTPDAQAALAWGRRRRVPTVMLFDSRAEDARRSPWREAVKRALVTQFDAALVAGTPQASYAEALGMPASHTFTPVDVVDNAHFADGADAARQRGAGEPYVLTVSRLMPRKNVGLVVRAHARYRALAEADGRAPWPLVVVGDGPERAALEAEAGEGVTFAGFAQIDALPAWYGAAGVFVHPARTDQWGLTVNEAMAAGLPVLVSRGAGCARDLVGGNGRTFDPGDPAALASLLSWITSDGADRAAMGARSRERIAAYSLDAFAEGLWDAVRAGAERADRGLALPARLVLGALALAGRRHRAFHTVEA